MLARLITLFVTVPLVELALLLYLGDKIGWPYAIGLVLVTAVVGAWLARQQGWRTWAHIRTELEAGRLPTTALLDAVMIFVAGALLLTPGMLTDLFGFSLLLPPCRRWYRKWLSRWLGQRFRIDTDFPFSASPSAEGDRDRIIDSYVVDRPDDEKPNP